MQRENLKISVVVYAKNEIDGIRAVLPKIKKEWYDQLVIIDGGSTDGTFEYAREHGYEIYRQAEPFWAGGYREAFRRATGDILVDFSPDGNSVPELIPQLTAKIREGCDLVIASRYLPGAKSEDDTLLTRFGNFLFTGLVNALFGGRFTDVLVIFRAYRRSLIRDCGLDGPELDHAFTTQSCVRAAKLKKKIAEIPGDEPKRIGGTPKMNVIRDGLLDLRLILWELLFYRPERKKP